MERGDLHPLTELTMTGAHWETMRAYVESQVPLEACGLLAGRNAVVMQVLLLANQARSEVSFRLDPAEQLKAFAWIESAGLEMLGIFHSHPAGPETVSAVDIEQAAYPVAHLVWSRQAGTWGARGFWIEGRGVHEITLRVIGAQ